MVRIVSVAGVIACCALAGVSPALAATPLDQATAEQRQTAQTKFAEGMEAYQAKKFDRALEAFRASYQTVASPNSHLMIARALRENGNLVEAYLEMKATSEEAGAAAAIDKKYDETARSAKNELEELSKRVAFVSLNVVNPHPDAVISLNGNQVDLSALNQPIVVNPGEVTVVGIAPGSPEASAKADLEPGATQTLDLVFEQPAEAPPPPPQADQGAPMEASTSGMTLRHWSYVAGGVGAAGIVTFAVFGALNQSQYSDLESACGGGPCSPDRQDDIDTGRTYQTVANVGLGVGIVGLGVGTTLFLLSKPSAEQSASTLPTLMVGKNSFVVKGSF